MFRTLLPFARPSRRFFVMGCLAACGVVAGRLALPWPLRAVADRWVSEPGAEGGAQGLITEMLPSASDYVLFMGVGFLLIILLLGMFDSLERLYFAKFAGGFVQQLRTHAFWSAMRIRSDDPRALSALSAARAEDNSNPDDTDDDGVEDRGGNAGGTGDLVSRLIGDTARVRSGLQGVLVHVATNGVVFLGVTLILCSMDMNLGLVFAVAGIVTAAVTVVAARSVFHGSFSRRQHEGALAEQITETLRGRPDDAKFVKIGWSGGMSESMQTKTQGLATWCAHAVFGTAVLAALWVGTQAVDAGRIAVGDILMMMMYALMMRGPTVRLARQGAKAGKVLGAARRLIQVLEAERYTLNKLVIRNLMPLRRSLRLDRISVAVNPAGADMRLLGPVTLDVTAGEKIAIVGRRDAEKTALLEAIGGVRPLLQGELFWDGGAFGAVSAKKRTSEIVLLSRSSGPECSGTEPDARSDSTFAERWLREFSGLIYRQGSLWLFDNPTEGLSEPAAKRLTDALLDAKGQTTVIVTTNWDSEIALFDRVVELGADGVVFDGPPTKWLRRSRSFVRSAFREEHGHA